MTTPMITNTETLITKGTACHMRLQISAPDSWSFARQEQQLTSTCRTSCLSRPLSETTCLSTTSWIWSFNCQGESGDMLINNPTCYSYFIIHKYFINLPSQKSQFIILKILHLRESKYRKYACQTELSLKITPWILIINNLYLTKDTKGTLLSLSYQYIPFISSVNALQNWNIQINKQHLTRAIKLADLNTKLSSWISQ